MWNSFFNALAIIVLYFFAKDIFKSRRAGIIAATLTAVSYQIVQYAGWISNPTVTVFTVPVFFYALWKYHQGKNWGLPLAFLFMGISIEFELFFVYLIPVGLILFILLRMKWPNLRILSTSIFLFCLATSSMIATEFKFHFAEVKSILGEGNYIGGAASHSSFFKLFVAFITHFDSYSLNFGPQFPAFGVIIGLIIMFTLGFELYINWKNKPKRDVLIFLIVYFLSPSLMFLFGTSNEPWFLIGRPKAIILAFVFVLLKIRPKILVAAIVAFIIIANLFAIHDSYGKGQVLLEPDASSIMSDQLKAIDYTYQNSNGNAFEINTLTNPLYINTVWAYQYYWYGRAKYNYLPSFIGGNQLYPYDTLPKPRGNEKYLYLLIDTTDRIPSQYRKQIIDNADKISKVIDEREFGGILVQERILSGRPKN